MSGLPNVVPEPARGVRRLLLRLLASRLSCALERSLPFRLIVWRLVPRLMRLTSGRLPLVPFAAGLLETRDARNGRPHRRAVVYFNDEDDVILVASKAGMPSDPHWLENALASPRVLFGGQRFVAAVVEDERELRRLWELGDAHFPSYATYRAHAARLDRQIPILRLSSAAVAEAGP